MAQKAKPKATVKKAAPKKARVPVRDKLPAAATRKGNVKANSPYPRMNADAKSYAKKDVRPTPKRAAKSAKAAASAHTKRKWI